MVKRAGRTLRPEEARLWRRVADRVTPRRPMPPSAPEQSDAAPAAPPAEALKPPERVSLRAAPPGPLADRGGEKRVRRGQVEIAGMLDLHGLTAPQAQSAVHRFLRHRHEEGARAVLIVTGKGRPNAERGWEIGVLKRHLPDWLAAPAVRGIVSGFAQAHRRHGGGGAYYVFLKSGNDSGR
ncbi:MAG: Smr/MutS family protein [Hyphomonadaceae bacterium]|nr:Smr/MutS family protein [Hyphomonadaceae bacterium]